MALVHEWRHSLRHGLLHSLDYDGGGGAPPPPVRGTPAPTLLELLGSTVNGTVFTTSALAPDDAAFIIIDVVATTAAETPTVAGLGVVWTPITVAAVGVRRVCRFAAYGPFTDGTITFTYGSTQASCEWGITQWLDIDTTDAEVQTVTATDNTGAATTLTSTLAAFEHASNCNYTVVVLSTAATVTHDADFTELGDDNETGNVVTMALMWAPNQTTCTPTFAAANCIMISSEIKSSES